MNRCLKCGCEIDDMADCCPGCLAPNLCTTCHGEGVIDSGGFTPWGAAIDLPCPDCEREQYTQDAAIGAAWRKDSSLQKWFPFTFEELRAVVDAIDRYISAAGYNEHTIILTKARADIVNSNFPR